MDAIEILRGEHKAVKAKMFEILRSADTNRKSLFAPFKREYELHDGIKTDVFYPAIASNPKAFGLRGMDPEARRVIANALRNLDALPGDSKDWFPYFRAIQGILKRQIDLEDIKVFEQVREAFGPDVLEELGRRMVDERRRRSIDPDGQATGAVALGVETKLGGKHAH